MGAIYPGKSSHRLKQRWQNIFKVTLSKIPWASTEDQLLVDIVQEKNYQRNWKEIALDLYSRSGLGIYRQGRQCRERWINHLDPSINRGYWTTEEDISLLKSYLELGRKWAEIAKRLRNRTENLVKNRWKTLMRRFKSLVCLDNLSSVSSHELDRGEKLERLIAQAVLHCYQKGTLITVPTKSETNQGALQYSPTKLSRSQSSLTHNSQDIAEDLSMKNDFPEFLALEEKKADLKSCIKPPQNRSRRKNMNQSDDNLLKNLCSGELVDRPVRFLDQSRESPGLKKFPSQNRSMHLSNSPFTPQLGESFSTISNWNTDNNTSYNTFKNDGLNGTFDCSYFSGEKPYGLNSGHTNYSFNSERMAFTKSKEDNQVILEEESFGCDDNLEIQMKGNNDITPQKGFISLSTANESNNTPFTLFRRNMQQDEGNPDAFINDDHLTKSECDMLDFFESEIDSISECGLNRTNNINDLTFCSKPGIGTREKSERDPNEFLCPDIDFGNPIRSDFAKPNNNRLVRRNSLDLLLEASDIMDGQETDDREMNLHLKGFSEFKAEERFNNQSGNSLFFAVVDTSKNELFLIDPVTKENFKPTVDTIKLRKQTYKPPPFGGFDFARYSQTDSMKNLKTQLSSFNIG